MSQLDKLIIQILELSSDLRFDEIKKVYIKMVKKIIEGDENEKE